MRRRGVLSRADSSSPLCGESDRRKELGDSARAERTRRAAIRATSRAADAPAMEAKLRAPRPRGDSPVGGGFRRGLAVVKATMKRTVMATSTATRVASGASLVACSRLQRDTCACAIPARRANSLWLRPLHRQVSTNRLRSVPLNRGHRIAELDTAAPPGGADRRSAVGSAGGWGGPDGPLQFRLRVAGSLLGRYVSPRMRQPSLNADEQSVYFASFAVHGPRKLLQNRLPT